MNLKFYLKELKVYTLYKLKRPIPCTVTINLTFRCNLKCYFCKIWRLNKRLDKSGLKKELSSKQIFALIDDLHKIGVPHAIIMGGEPLLRPDVEEIGFYLKKREIVPLLVTNGTLITPKRAERLSKAYDFIRVSLDGFGETHNRIRGVDKAYEKAIQGLKHLIDAEGRTARVGVHFVLTKENHNELDQMITFFEERVDSFTVLPVFSDKGIDLDRKTLNLWRKTQRRIKEYGLCDQIDEYFKGISYTIGKKYCDAGKLYFVFNPDGDVRACARRPYTVGNINYEPFYDIWKRGLNEKTKEQIKHCPGCYAKCTTEKSMIFRKNPLELLKDSIRILKTYKI